MNGCTVLPVGDAHKLATMDKEELHIRENPLSQVGNSAPEATPQQQSCRQVGNNVMESTPQQQCGRQVGNSAKEATLQQQSCRQVGNSATEATTQQQSCRQVGNSTTEAITQQQSCRQVGNSVKEAMPQQECGRQFGNSAMEAIPQQQCSSQGGNNARESLPQQQQRSRQIGNSAPAAAPQQQCCQTAGLRVLCASGGGGGGGELATPHRRLRSSSSGDGELATAHGRLRRSSSVMRLVMYRPGFVVTVLVLIFVLLIGALVLVGMAHEECTNNRLLLTSIQKAARQEVCLTEACVRTAATLLSAMDRTVSPCDDFFQYACGSWNKKHVIPEDKSSINVFDVLSDQLHIILKGVLEEPSNDEDSSATRKAKLFYKSCMDIKQIRLVGDAPVRAVLRSLGGWPVTEGHAWTPPPGRLEVLLGRLRGEFNMGWLIEQWVGPDDKNSSVNILQLDQIPLALPSRDYYLKPSSERDYLAAYHKYMVEMAVLLGATNRTQAEAEMSDVIQFEKRLAEAVIPEADRHDHSLIYQKLTLAELQAEVPQIDWLTLITQFLELRLDLQEPVVAYCMSYFKQMGVILQQTDRRVIHNYLLWRFVMEVVPHMVDDYQAKEYEFRRTMSGVERDLSRWTQCVEWTNKKMGMAVGALYIRQNFDQHSKAVALEMIHTIREAFNELLAEQHWMDAETRSVAKEKADAMNEKIGYPDLMTDPEELSEEYTMLNITADEFLVNILNIYRYDARHNLQNLGQPVNKDKWAINGPAIVNAFYNPNKNDIVFPAGILQPSFYSLHFPKSLNYGGIGVVIGHEMTHGFDDKGRQFDKEGNMKQWWNNATIVEFRRRTQCIIEQYSRYKLDDVGHFLNGKMTQGENIADNGGLKQSFRAYRKWVAKNGEEALLPGINLTHNQLFFLNYAQIWCGTMRPEEALNKVRSGVHSPGPVRVTIPLSNSKDFSDAYNCPPGSPMNPIQKCSVW